MSATPPTLASVIRRAIGAALADVHTSIPARVESYDDDSMTCSAQPLIKRGFIDEAGERQTEILPVVQDVPVIFPGGGGRVFKFPLAAGDTVLLVISEASLDRGFDRVIDPGDDRRFNLSDAIAIPFATDGNATVILEVTATEVIVGGAGAVSTIKGPAYRSAEDTMLGLLQAFLTSLAPGLITTPQVTAAAAANTGIATFLAAAASYLTTVAKVK